MYQVKNLRSVLLLLLLLLYFWGKIDCINLLFWINILMSYAGWGACCSFGFCRSTLDNSYLYSGRGYNSYIYKHKEHVPYSTTSVKGSPLTSDKGDIWLHCFSSWVWGSLHTNIWLVGWTATSWHVGSLVKAIYWRGQLDLILLIWLRLSFTFILTSYESQSVLPHTLTLYRTTWLLNWQNIVQQSQNYFSTALSFWFWHKNCYTCYIFIVICFMHI